MKKYFIYCLIIFASISMIANFSYSQDKITSKNKIIDYLKNEKVRFSPEKMFENIKKENLKNKHQLRTNQNSIQQSKEFAVSDNSNPESEISAVINPKDTNNIIISAIKQDLTNSFAALTCPIYYTTDFGKIWSTSSFVTVPSSDETMVLGGGDPMFAYDNNGTAYFSWIHLYWNMPGFIPDSTIACVYWAYSTDGGDNWSRSASKDYVTYDGDIIGSAGIYGLTQMHDKEWMAVDQSESQYKNTLYLAMTYLGQLDTQTPTTTVVVYRKLPGSTTFSTDTAIVSKGVYDEVQFTSIDVDKVGDVHVTYYVTKDKLNSLYHSYSTDGGETFSQSVKISDFTLSGALMIPGNPADSIVGMNPARLFPCPQIAIDKYITGNLYMTWTADGTDKVEKNGLEIYFSVSEDKGKTWSKPIVINDDSKTGKTSQYYASMSVNPNGVIIISWYDRRDDTKDKLAHYYMTYSFDNGKTFIPSFKVTTQPTNFSTVGEMNGGMGIAEYNTVLSTKGYAIPVWCDGRTNDGDLNVYAAFVPISKNPVSVERIVPINSDFILSEPVPNPADNNVNLTFELKNQSNVNLYIYDIQGNIIKEITNGMFDKGKHDYNVSIENFNSGEYFVKIEVGGAYSVKKIVVSK